MSWHPLRKCSRRFLSLFAPIPFASLFVSSLLLLSREMMPIPDNNNYEKQKEA